MTDKHDIHVFSSDMDDMLKYIYLKPYARIGPYVLGVICGLVYHSVKYYKKHREHYDYWAYRTAKSIDILYVRWFLYLLGAVLMLKDSLYMHINQI